MAQPDLRDVHKKSSTTSNIPKITTGSTEQLTPINSEEFSSSSDLENLRKHLKMQGISERASKLITVSRNQGTISNYESAWEKWSRWCSEQKVDPVKCSVNYVLDFLAYLFGMGFKYYTINSHRSVISAYHDYVEHSPVGQYSRFSALMTGVFNAFLPKPKIFFIWDVEKVLFYFDNLLMNEEISGRFHLLKLTTLLSVTSPSRGHEIAYLNVKYMYKEKNSFIFHLSKVTKKWERSKCPPKLEPAEFTTNRKLCVVFCLEEYLKRLKSWRSLSEKDQVLLSHLKLRRAVFK